MQSSSKLFFWRKYSVVPKVRISGWSLQLLFLGTVPAGILLAFYMIVQSVHPGAQSVGYRGATFGTQIETGPTGEKPQNKLWYHDHSWWGILWSEKLNSFSIHRYDELLRKWVTTPVTADPRFNTKCDVLWDGTHLYVASHYFVKTGKLAGIGQNARLYRYHYEKTTKLYEPDEGFPASINYHQSESLVLEKDSTGQLWITWPFKGHVMINRSLGDDRFWGEPFHLPSQGDDLDVETISSLIAFEGKVGVMWSDQTSHAMYFAVHLDSALDMEWQERETALHIPGQKMADDHIHLKTHHGKVWAVTKTSMTEPTEPLIVLLKRGSHGKWSWYPVGLVKDKQTRPILMIEEELGRLYVITSAIQNHAFAIYLNQSDMENISFQPGRGQPIIFDYHARQINDPSGSKQNINSETGLMILASDVQIHTYFHYYAIRKSLALN